MPASLAQDAEQPHSYCLMMPTDGDRVCLYTVFGPRDRPLAAGINHRRIGTKIFKLYSGRGTTIYEIEKNIKAINQIVTHAADNHLPIITADFKSHLRYLQLPLDVAIDYGVYDLCLPCTLKGADYRAAELAVTTALTRMVATPLAPWQRILANAAVVYQDLENTGILFGYVPHHAKWSQQTFTGRSSTSGFNLHGLDDSVHVLNPRGVATDLFVCFDWVAADVNVAAHLSEDDQLKGTFIDSDPYTVLSGLLELPRDDCKLALLSTLNQLDTESPLVTDVFPKLGIWMRTAKDKLQQDGCLETILGRRFALHSAKNVLAVLNGVYQGSVAHAMHLALRRIWERYRANLLVEIHDSVVLTCRPDKGAVRSLVTGVVEIMTRPFGGLLDLFFPVRVSIGKQYRHWQELRTYREGNHAQSEPAAGQESGSGTPTQA